MCGIAGILTSGPVRLELLRSMATSLAHRGPDDQGCWIDQEAGIGFAHRRLSIIDISPAGHQPMMSSCGRFVFNYNGEIYNFDQIRKELDSSGKLPTKGWRGYCDTEVLLQAISAWGLQEALERSVGQFAFALWDRQDRVLSLVRDRFGEKPLYYGWIGSDFLFGSELKAFRRHPRFANEIDRHALQLFAERTCIPSPLSIYRRIFKLQPGSFLTIPAAAAAMPLDSPPVEDGPGPVRLTHYWSYRDVVRNGFADPIRNEVDALAELDSALGRAVTEQSLADVPVGMFLSGGIDSSTIAAIYQRCSNQPARTFSIGFDDRRYNEAPFARLVAQHLGTIHHEEILTERSALDVIPRLSSIYDEPFADSSQIPTYLVSQIASSEISVALTGDGGDELFGGYYRHFHAPRLWRRISRVPAPLRAAVGAPLSRLPGKFWRGAALLLRGNGGADVGPKLHKAVRASAAARQFCDVYSSFLDEWSVEGSPVLQAKSRSDDWHLDIPGNAPDELRIMYRDAVSYLPNDILCKVDRASMAVSLETRIPFLDHRVAEVAARIPLEFKISNGAGKRILRKLLYREVPRQMLERPKAGFAIPLGDWLRGPLRDWAEELLDERRLKDEGWFDAPAVRRRWRRHLAATQDSSAAMWAVLMFQAWLAEQRREASIGSLS